jgi:tetratricopeptide (TPR) repeat protein
MSLIGDQTANAEAIASLSGELASTSGVIPFVGAGLSVPWRLPAWTPFLIEAGRAAGVEAPVRADIDSGRYEEAAERIAAAMRLDAFDRLVSDTFSDERMTPPDDRAPVELLPQLARGPVVTTNFDRVLERVFRDAGRAFDLELWGAKVSLATDALAEDYRMLVKLHGDSGDGTDRVLTLSEYARHYGGLTASDVDRERPLPRLLGRLFASRPVLFLGCSLRSDRYLGVLESLAPAGENREHFAVVEAPAAKREYEERASFFRRHHVRPIWYPAGQHRELLPFLEEMAGLARGSGSRVVTLPVSISPDGRVTGRRPRETGERARRDRLRAEWRGLRDDEARVAFAMEHGEFLNRAGFWSDYIRVAGEAVEAARRLGRPLDAAELLNNMSLVKNRIGDRRDAEASLADAWRLIRRRPREPLHVTVLHNQALADYEAGRWASAEAGYRRALEAATEVGDERLTAIWRNLGSCMARRGGRQEGAALIRRAMSRSVRDGDIHGEVRSLIALGDIHDSAGEWRKMCRVLKRAENRLLAMPVPDRQTTAQVLDNIGVSLYHLGDLQGAVRYYLKALAQEQSTDDRPAQISTLLNIAWLHFDAFVGPGSEGRRADERVRTAAFRRSAEYYEQALARARALRSSSAVAGVLSEKALVTAALGDRTTALEELAQAVAILRRRGAHARLGTAMNNIGRIVEDGPGGPRKAVRYYRAAVGWAGRAGDRGLERTTLFNLATALRDAGRVAEAYEEARKMRLKDRNCDDRYSALHHRLYTQLKGMMKES